MDIKDNIIFCFYGFYRDSPGLYNFNIKDFAKFLYVPKLKDEDLDESTPENIITREELVDIYGDSRFECNLYDYDKEEFIKKSKELNVPRHNQFFQQPYRYFSFFNNIRQVLRMTESHGFNDDTIIILARVDVGISKLDFNKVFEYLDDHDVIAGANPGYFGHNNGYDGCDDKWFIFKYKNIKIFTDLYDDYAKYLTDFYDESKEIELKATRPEDIFAYHFNNYGLKRIHTSDIHYQDGEVLSYVFRKVFDHEAFLLKHGEK